MCHNFIFEWSNSPTRKSITQSQVKMKKAQIVKKVTSVLHSTTDWLNLKSSDGCQINYKRRLRVRHMTFQWLLKSMTLLVIGDLPKTKTEGTACSQCTLLNIGNQSVLLKKSKCRKGRRWTQTSGRACYCHRAQRIACPCTHQLWRLAWSLLKTSHSGSGQQTWRCG